MAKCGMKCEIFSRVVGYHRPVQQWNKGKKEEFKQRKEFCEKTSLASNYGNRGMPKTKLEAVNHFTA